LVPTVPSSEQRLMLAAKEPQAPEEPGRQEPILVFENGSAANGAGSRVEHVVDEIHLAVVLEFGFIPEADRNRVLHIARRGPRPSRGETHVMQEIRLAAVKHEVNGIDRYNYGQERRAGWAAGDEVAGIDAPVGNAPGNRCAHFGPFKIELGLF
jgi:hypothetical protein